MHSAAPRHILQAYPVDDLPVHLAPSPPPQLPSRALCALEDCGGAPRDNQPLLGQGELHVLPRTVAVELEELAILKRVCDTQKQVVVGTWWASKSDTDSDIQSAGTREREREEGSRTAAARSSRTARTCGVRHLPWPGQRRRFALIPSALGSMGACQRNFWHCRCPHVSRDMRIEHWSS
jgi:hypothetical protein